MGLDQNTVSLFLILPRLLNHCQRRATIERVAAFPDRKFSQKSVGFPNITNAAAREVALRRIQEMTPLQSEDVANAIVYAVTQPPHVNVNEILLRPTEQDR
jgi:hypothetical protein